MKKMEDNDKKKAAAIGIALFLTVAALGFAIAAMQGDSLLTGNDADGTGDEFPANEEDRIRDTDMAPERDGDDQFQQADDAMLAQANQLPQGMLQLLR